MGKIIVDQDEFANVIVSYIFDKMLHPDDVSAGNEEFTKLISKISQMGGKPLFMKYYLNLDASERLQYKRIKDSLAPDATVASTITMKPVKFVPQGKLKSIAKKVIKKLLLKQSLDVEEIEMITEKLEEIE